MTNFDPTILQIGDHTLTLRPAAVEEILPLRQVVLIDGTDHPSPEFDGDRETTTLHIGVFDAANRAVACATVMQQSDNDTPAWRLRGMATDPAYRGEGVGAAVMRYLQQMLVEADGPMRMWCNARINAVPFYRRTGWQTVGETFTIAGVGPHVRMIRWL